VHEGQFLEVLGVAGLVAFGLDVERDEEEYGEEGAEENLETCDRDGDKNVPLRKRPW